MYSCGIYFGTIAQTGTPRMSWRDRSQKVTSHFDIVGLRHRESRMEAPRAQALTPRRCGAIAMLKWNLCIYDTRVMLLCIICGHNVPFKMELKASTRRVNRSASGGSNDTSKSCKQVNKKADIHDEILIHTFRRENLNYFWARKFELVLGAKFKNARACLKLFFLQVVSSISGQ